MAENEADGGDLEAFAEDARRRSDVITAGLTAGTDDYESLRVEAEALRDGASATGMRRLAELGGLMESDLADAVKAGELREARANQIAEAAEAMAQGARAAAGGEEEPPDVGRSLAQLFTL